ncbi:hypothetical protein BT63DRAFT_458389 [Microthyrium microscopicum]|uniref:Uncharacterized protein n=1 Tax=Microthyrium microscopicum TaxID=703497 RepID=A0A6A6U3L5_9PEZI|nr:hypothetical protein BT63DRAFT_458389 [Microthyrium microscopicum]
MKHTAANKAETLIHQLHIIQQEEATYSFGETSEAPALLASTQGRPRYRGRGFESRVEGAISRLTKADQRSSTHDNHPARTTTRRQSFTQVTKVSPKSHPPKDAYACHTLAIRKQIQNRQLMMIIHINDHKERKLHQRVIQSDQCHPRQPANLASQSPSSASKPRITVTLVSQQTSHQSQTNKHTIHAKAKS